jgi:SAM-dependent methyltransferase
MRERVNWRLQRAQVRLTRPVARIGLRRTPVDPNFGFNRGRPIDRYYIEQFMSRESDVIAGRVLEIEHDIYTRQFGGARVSRSDILHIDPDFDSATVVADLTDAPQIDTEDFDCLIVSQTLQYIYDVSAAVRTMHRILRPGGAALVTVPVTSRLQGRPCDGGVREYWRFTSMSAHRLFGDVFGSENVRVAAYGNLPASLAQLSGLAAEDLRKHELDEFDPLYELLIGVCAQKSAYEA